MPDYYTLAQAIDQTPREVSDWEAGFLDSILRRGPLGCRTLSPKQQAKLCELGDRYLSPTVMAEFHGQQVLL